MITHFSHLQLNTVSVQGVKQFYHGQLRFPIVYESDNEIRFQPTEYFTLSFKETAESLAPAHFAFEVPYSEFENIVNWLQSAGGVTLLKWPDGRIVDDFETGMNVYFRDGDGNLLEIITHHYINEGILTPFGELKILYLREIGFPVDSVIDFRKLLVDIFNFKLDKISDTFTFAIGGTSHAVIPSKKRKWIPIAMTALPPTMKVVFGVSSSDFMEKVKTNLSTKSIHFDEFKEHGRLNFRINEYDFNLRLTNFPEEIPMLLNLPYSR
ncbi:glyoxalase/bleomycin resistance/dioxygenase family protein [Paenibacillus chondroitinus]|uniref:Glyoxalase/bleomycin resistance/dioxygenase family protein n=1 Tax=Paenibacillus chondroitinus TaxID=59842 RepID=A0ABU6DNQ2_9BACL|nr:MULTISPECIES: glyoxalase/bleomycin resistance/dioxygenase family protein [Paenibacillus]MCY9663088.1 glyoxalase/bleomycin resistance/dioxygenase family protein [Paenibacillus anseongense]MEB4799239.1 glyoxalase/bleomycin resistance/dioxygenase family protein [Paenibacillus chondroitinus]